MHAIHAVLVSLGTDGDVYPYVGLGMRLRSRGHRVTLAANEHFRALASDLGFDFRPLMTNEETHRLLANPDVWHPVKSALLGVRLGVELTPRQYALLAELARDENTVLVAHPGVPAARFVQEKLSRPLATLLLQPWTIQSASAPPVMPGGLTLPRWAPRWAGSIYWRLIDATGDLLVARHLNRIRASLDLKPIRRFLKWWLSPELVIGMFPHWYGPPQRDWPPHLKLAGFPMYDGGRESSLPSGVLEFCRAGEPPIVFTFGTGMMHAGSFFRAASEACRALHGRGLFLTKYRDQLPSPLPSFIRHFEFAPFLELLPHCAAIVHHGGVGTVAKALATGTPQLILPLAWDQPDNAARVKRLGAGDWLKPKQRSGARIANALAELMTPRIQARCRAVALQFGNDDALNTAAQLVEEIAHRAPGSRPRTP